LGDFAEILYAKDKVNGYWVNFNNKTRATGLRAQPGCNDANQRDRHPRERYTEETKNTYWFAQDTLCNILVKIRKEC